MPRTPETGFAPALEPSDPTSLPPGLALGTPAYAALAPDRRGRARGRRWLRRVAESRPLVGHFCVSDRTLRRLERTDPLGLGLARDAGVTSVVTMDVPLYGFFTEPQRERAHAVQLHRLLRTVDEAPRWGLGAMPLVKALDADRLGSQLDLVAELGLDRAALYARELLLEGNRTLVRRFVRGAHRRGIRPILLGACAPGALRWGPAELVARHHYVLARRGLALDARARRAPVRPGAYCRRAARFLTRDDAGGLCGHNYHVLRDRVERAAATPPLGG